MVWARDQPHTGSWVRFSMGCTSVSSCGRRMRARFGIRVTGLLGLMPSYCSTTYQYFFALSIFWPVNYLRWKCSPLGLMGISPLALWSLGLCKAIGYSSIAGCHLYVWKVSALAVGWWLASGYPKKKRRFVFWSLTRWLIRWTHLGSFVKPAIQECFVCQSFHLIATT